MQRALRSLIWIFLLLSSVNVRATHLVGGFISYEYKGASSVGVRYAVTIVAYRDCKGDVKLADEINVCVYRRDNLSLYKTVTFKLGQLQKVNPVGRTDCPEATQVCLERGIYYRSDVDLERNSSGYILQYQVCCRNTQVNLQDNSSGVPFIGMTFQTTIPSTYVKNSSPFFTDVPVPYICINDTTELNNYALDPDGDSLVYQLVTPWKGGNTNNASPVCDPVYSPPASLGAAEYKTGYDGNAPFGSQGVATINAKNGITTYFATQTGNYATAIDLIEYRNGVRLSTTRLDLQIIVINCAPNHKPKITNSTKTYEIIAGGKLCFDVEATDEDDQNITLKGIGDILTGANGFKGNRATFTTVTGKSRVTSQFCWQTECTQARTEPYLFTANVVDDGCPSKYTYVNISIKVNPFTGKVTMTGPATICQGSRGNIYTLKPTANTPQELIGLTYNVVVTNGTLDSKNGNLLSITWDKNALSGNIEVEPVSQFGCKGPKYNFPVTLLPSPPLPPLTNIDTVCPGTGKVYSVPSTAGYRYQWWVSNGSFTGGTTSSSANINWGVPGKAWAKLVQYGTNNCPSDTAQLNVWVSKPKTSPIKGAKTICPNTNRILYNVTVQEYGSTFKWFVTGGTIASQTGNSVRINWGDQGQGMVKVIEINRFGCPGDTVYLPVLKTYNLVADTIVGDTSFCEFSIIVYTVPYTNHSIYNWSITGGTILSGQLTNTITVSWGAYGTGNLSMYETSYDSLNAKQCISAPTNRIINIRQKPVQNIINGDFELCQTNGVGIYNIAGFPKSTYLWAINNDTSDISGQGTATIQFPYSNFGNFKFHVIETTEYGCTGKPIDTTLVIHPKPLTTPISGDSIICYPNLNSYQYSTTGFAKSTFYWFVNGGTPAPVSNTGNITIDWSGQQLNQLKVLEVSEFGCIGDTVRLDVFYDNPSIYLNYLTVNPPPAGDNGIDLFWTLKNAPRYNAMIDIERKDAGTSNPFVKVGSVNGNQITFNHGNINTDFNAFDYRIKGYDLCGKPLYTSVHTNILLTGKKVNGYDVQLGFTPYIGWGNNAVRYDVYRKLKNTTEYELYEANVSSFEAAYSNGLEYYTQCYRIKATKLGSDTATWSNEICFDFDPILFIPNAFSPNHDEVNTTFVMKGGALRTVELSIFNRWGEKLWVGNSIKAEWDGTYKGKDQPQDVYLYYCYYTGFDGRKYSTKGTITLLR